MATYYVRPTNGSDAAAGTSFATAFKTLQKAVDTAASAGDVIRVCPEANETITAAIDFDTNTGADGNPITIEPGNTTDGSRDLSLFYTITTASAINLLNFTATSDYYKIYNLIVNAAAAGSVCLNNQVDGSDFHVFINCRFTGATGSNISVRGTSTGGWVFIDCETDLAGASGIAHATGNRGSINWFGGSIHDNTSHGWDCNKSDCILIGAEVYDNGGDGLFGSTNSNRLTVIGNTFYGNTGDGISLDASDHVAVVYNNSSSGNGGYGFNFNTTNVPRWMDYNHTHNNTSGAADITMPGSNNQTGDPQFTSVTDGSEDFTPADGSPLDGNGLMGVDIGARSSIDPASGGGLLTHPGMTGGFNA